jgi:erythromycin esterase
MNRFFIGLFFFISCYSYTQDEQVVSWINEHAIVIEDAHPSSQLSMFHSKVPRKFLEAKIFGFGEATHHGKEFFDIKTKFFKYLVENYDVRVFILEDSYPSEAGINEWISGGNGDAATIAEHFSLAPWYCQEVVDLLAWMRAYNQDKAIEEQIRFYGMDMQHVVGIDREIRDLVKTYHIPVEEELLIEVDRCVEKNVDYRKSNDWADKQIPKLKEIESIILDFQKNIEKEHDIAFKSVLRALHYLMQYTYYVQHHYSQDRDLKMFENVKWIVEHHAANGKAFIWSHNEHINTKGFGHYSNRNIYNLGRHLKEYFKDDYYSVGFDFGGGALGGYVFKPNEKTTWKVYQVNEPFPKTYAQTLYRANSEIFFLDMSLIQTEKTNFFKKKNKQLILGGPGYNPNQNNLYTKNFSAMYDGLIFIKMISVPGYTVGNE